MSDQDLALADGGADAFTEEAAERQGVANKRQAKKSDELERRETLALIMSQPNGRRFVWWQLEAGHVFHSSFGHNALATAFNEGERNQALRLLSEAQRAAPDAVALMLRECGGGG